jgi:hypothetical protein
MSGVPNGGRGSDGVTAGGTGVGAAGIGGFNSTAFGPPGAVFVPDQRSGDGQVTITFTPS